MQETKHSGEALVDIAHTYNVSHSTISRLRIDGANALSDAEFSIGAAGQSWNSIQAATGCSRATIAKIAKREKAA